MKNTFKNIYQLKLSMKGIVPQIWRRIQVPENYTFLDLHYAIQAAMNWEDYHLHEFEMLNLKTGKLDRIGTKSDDYEDFYDESLVPEKKTKISNYFTLENKEALYRYDFGDNWQVKVRLEKILPRKEEVEYPVCTAGKRAAVPEDIGGIWGYENMLEILKDPEHEEYEDTIEWLGEDFDPEYFDPKDVSF
ncbi:TnpR protein [Methanosarcina horonobensis HB-1 = JCM 15518]|uniref:TnpR protein n=1 Tax=Methanosarcina horonobensis HB-1 = JCM 15518 TaxID=1434110 RepID=A0A0E3SFX2_9EURY|nr:plasmid pRiA4b ORF-3 family protein [Methanosarcina horonobensis]AKB78433.1 TnpR protein [Methanosarcina horonobensis HB-1 = JCM 15518]